MSKALLFKKGLKPVKARIRRWVDALRSGEYEQCRNQLVEAGAPGEADQFCCLGVATNLYVEETGRVEDVWEDPDDRRGCGVELHEKVRRYFGLPDHDPRAESQRVDGMHIAPALSMLNDGWTYYSDNVRTAAEPKGFDDIADAIEKEYLS